MEAYTVAREWPPAGSSVRAIPLITKEISYSEQLQHFTGLTSETNFSDDGRNSMVEDLLAAV
jgi:hypothetical protein